MYSDMSKLTKHKSETNHSVTNQNQVAWRIQALNLCFHIFLQFADLHWTTGWWVILDPPDDAQACLGFPKFHAPIFFWFACATLRLFGQKMFFCSSATANFPTVTWKLASDLGRMALAIIPRSWTRARRRRTHEATVSNCLIFGCQAFWPKNGSTIKPERAGKIKERAPLKVEPQYSATNLLLRFGHHGDAAMLRGRAAAARTPIVSALLRYPLPAIRRMKRRSWTHGRASEMPVSEGWTGRDFCSKEKIKTCIFEISMS